MLLRLFWSACGRDTAFTSAITRDESVFLYLRSRKGKRCRGHTHSKRYLGGDLPQGALSYAGSSAPRLRHSRLGEQ
jgi:hypothetical protein